MTEAYPANPQLAIVLPLAAVANQLMRIEADLRSLNMKALVYAAGREQGGLAEQIAAGLEKINDELELIRGLTANIAADVQAAAPASQADD
jgi:hypothetical protein